MNMTADAPLLAADGVPLAVKLKRAERRKKLRAALLVAPLAVFLLATFILPIALLLYRSVENPEVPAMLPKTVSALAGWQGQGLPDEAVLGVFAQELTAAKDNKAMVGNAAKRLNMEISGYRSLLTKTVRAMPLDPAAGPLREQFVNIDERWAEADYWRVLRHQDSRYTGSFIFIDRLNNVTIGAGMVEESVEWTAHSNPVTAEDRAARCRRRSIAGRALRSRRRA